MQVAHAGKTRKKLYVRRSSFVMKSVGVDWFDHSSGTRALWKALRVVLAKLEHNAGTTFAETPTITALSRNN